ncbi:hypothetical protein BU23DRAFT_549902, partial [Bimuria novae-zelandiae CBS 107.79]
MAEKGPTPNPDALGIQRGDYNRNLAGPLLLGVGKLISIPLQHWVITSHPLSSFGIPHPPTDGSVTLPLFGAQPLLPTLFLGMTLTLILKQNAWLWGYCAERLTLPFAVFGVIVPAIYECLCALVFTAAGANPLWRREFLYAGAALHFLAAATELACEVDRARFKRRKESRGRLYKGGAFGVVRHPNYACNVVYGTAYGFAAGGPGFAVFS